MNVFELGILDFIQETFRCTFLDVFFPIVTKFGDGGIFWIAVSILFLCFKKTRRTGLMMGAALTLGVLIVNCGIKPLVARTRPYDLNPAIELLVDKLADGSFPSGHTLACFECTTVLMFRDKRFGIPALVLSILVALSRLYLYVHYPSDVLVGLLLGILFGWCGMKLVGYLLDRYDRRGWFPDASSPVSD
jgi:undecaprenyl-diphosphatase